MPRYVNIDQIIADIYDKWGCDPAYIANDTPTGVEARRDAELIERLRCTPGIVIVTCRECEFYHPAGWCYHPRGLRGGGEMSDYCCWGKRRKKNDGRDN